MAESPERDEGTQNKKNHRREKGGRMMKSLPRSIGDVSSPSTNSFHSSHVPVNLLVQILEIAPAFTLRCLRFLISVRPEAHVAGPVPPSTEILEEDYFLLF